MVTRLCLASFWLVEVFSAIYLIKFCILIISLKLAKKRKRNMKKKVLVTPGFEPLCVRQLDYKKDSWITQPPRVVYYSPAALF